MPLVEYPKLLTDASWKRVEKAAGVSATGVGKTLRDAETTWKALVAEIAGLEAGKVTPAKADTGKKATITALGKSETLLKGVTAKVKTADKKKILTEYAAVIGYLSNDLAKNFNVVNDHRDLAFVVSKMNSHVKADLSNFKSQV